MIAHPFLREAQINGNSVVRIYFTWENYINKWINLCMKNSNSQKKRVDKLLPVVAVVDDPLTRVFVDAWDPSFRPKLERNIKPKLVIQY